MRTLSMAFYPSPLGRLTLAAEGAQLVGLWFEGQRHYAAGVSPEHAEQRLTPPLCAACAWLDAYFAGRRPAADALPLAPVGSTFRRAVWRLLQKIPYGCTTTYGALAAELKAAGIAASAQAVGGAVGPNPISIIIPCHRVLAAHPAAAWNYAAGADRKRALLQLESAKYDAEPSRGIGVCKAMQRTADTQKRKL